MMEGLESHQKLMRTRSHWLITWFDCQQWKSGVSFAGTESKHLKLRWHPLLRKGRPSSWPRWKWLEVCSVEDRCHVCAGLHLRWSCRHLLRCGLLWRLFLDVSPVEKRDLVQSWRYASCSRGIDISFNLQCSKAINALWHAHIHAWDLWQLELFLLTSAQGWMQIWYPAEWCRRLCVVFWSTVSEQPVLFCASLGLILQSRCRGRISLLRSPALSQKVQLSPLYPKQLVLPQSCGPPLLTNLDTTKTDRVRTGDSQSLRAFLGVCAESVLVEHWANLD